MGGGSPHIRLTDYSQWLGILVYFQYEISPRNHSLNAKTMPSSIGTGGLWAAGFQDSILFRDGQLDAMFNYLRDNPRRLAIKKLMPDLFRVRREIGITLMLPHQAQQAAAGAARDVAGTEVPRLRAYFSAIGNIHLLDEPNIIQIQCSRSHFQYKRIPKPGGGRKIAIDSSKIPVY